MPMTTQQRSDMLAELHQSAPYKCAMPRNLPVPVYRVVCYHGYALIVYRIDWKKQDTRWTVYKHTPVYEHPAKPSANLPSRIGEVEITPDSVQVNAADEGFDPWSTHDTVNGRWPEDSPNHPSQF